MTSISDLLRERVWSFLLPGENEAWKQRVDHYNTLQDYYSGRQKRQLVVRPQQADDNLVTNFSELVIERSISMLLGDGLEFELPDEANQEYIDEVMQANRQSITLYDAAQNAAIYGTGYIKIVPAGVESKSREDVLLPRLVVLDPRWMDIQTEPEDIGSITGYEMRYSVGDMARKEVTEVYVRDGWNRISSWQISSYEVGRSTGGKWVLTNQVLWEYEFPPIVHWKNLPLANDVYGRSDLDSVIELQDRLNFVASNISKIIRYHAHPKTWGRGAGLGNKASWGADEIVMVNGQDAMIQNLEMSTDLASSRQFYNDLKASIMEISRTVDLASMKDKVGALTNFGLRVLYNDALDKNSTKRDTFGEALLELVHRLLVLANRQDTNPGYIEWPDPLPENETETIQGYAFDLDHNLVSKETISERRGYDYEDEAEHIQEEAMMGDNVGSLLLRAFDRGETVPRRTLPPAPTMPEEEVTNE